MLKICLSKNFQRQKRKLHDLNHAWGEGVGKGIKMKNLDSVPSRLLKPLAWDNNQGYELIFTVEIPFWDEWSSFR